MLTHRSLVLAASLLPLLAAACSSPPARMEKSAWRDRVRTLEAKPVEASAKVELPPALKGPLLSKSLLVYELRHGTEEAWDVRVHGPDRSDQSLDSWAGVTLTSPGNRNVAIVKSARVYSGRINVARKGKQSEDELLLMALAFTGDGLFKAASVLGPMDAEDFAASTDTQATADAYMGGFLSGFAASFTVDRSKEVASLMAKFMQWPSGLLGLDYDAPVTIQPDVLAAEPCSTEFGPGWRVPIEVVVDGDQAFVGTVTLVEPAGALNLSAGLVGASGFAPHRPEETVRLRLTGAHAPRTDHLKPQAIESLLVIKPRSRSEATAL